MGAGFKVQEKTSLDELPQIINVLRGEMSLVGPRPPIPAEVEEYEVWQRRRLSMKPGLTCIWQCAPKRNEIGFNEWMKMDLHYIDNWSLWLDLKINFSYCQSGAVGGGRGKDGGRMTEDGGRRQMTKYRGRRAEDG